MTDQWRWPGDTREPIKPEDLTQEQEDEAFMYHAATGGDLIFYTDGTVDYVG